MNIYKKSYSEVFFLTYMDVSVVVFPLMAQQITTSLMGLKDSNLLSWSGIPQKSKGLAGLCAWRLSSSKSSCVPTGFPQEALGKSPSWLIQVVGQIQGLAVGAWGPRSLPAVGWELFLASRGHHRTCAWTRYQGLPFTFPVLAPAQPRLLDWRFHL